jgi:succinyl-diaminopimelate desuccinylase
MKGPLAAAVTAIERTVTSHGDHRGSIALLVTSDEEGAAVDGTVAVVEALKARGESIDQCLVVESTSIETLGDGIKNGRRGSLNGILTVRGLQSHIAYPERGRNPIHLAAPALAELTSAVWDSGNEYFPPTSFQISNVHAGTGANNVVPGSMSVVFNFRFSTASTVDSLKDRLVGILDRHKMDYAIEWSVSGLPFLTPRGPLVAVISDAIRVVTGGTPALSTGGGTSDARFLASIAGEVLEFGPLNESMHQVNEHIRLADLAPLSRIYELTLRSLLGLPPNP